MKKKQQIIIAVVVFLTVLLPVISFAAPSYLLEGVCDGVKVPCDFAAFARLINNVINWFVYISISIAAITFAYAGAQMLFHPDEPSKREEAKEMFKKTVIGMFIILGAWLVIRTIIVALTGATTGSGFLRFFK